MNNFTFTAANASAASRMFAKIVREQGLIIATKGRAAWNQTLRLECEGISLALSSGYYFESSLEKMF